jgi:hypothetical protein
MSFGQPCWGLKSMRMMTIDVTRVAAGALRGEGGFDPRFGFSRANARFELRAKVLRAELSERMQDYLRVLDGGAGLFGRVGMSPGVSGMTTSAPSQETQGRPKFPCPHGRAGRSPALGRSGSSRPGQASSGWVSR